MAGYGAWLVLAAVFAAAWVQGAEFASEKDSATFWGCVIGFAAFLAWLAVEDEADDDDSEGEEDEAAADEAKSGEAKKERSAATTSAAPLTTKRSSWCSTRRPASFSDTPIPHASATFSLQFDISLLSFLLSFASRSYSTMLPADATLYGCAAPTGSTPPVARAQDRRRQPGVLAAGM